MYTDSMGTNTRVASVVAKCPMLQLEYETSLNISDGLFTGTQVSINMLLYVNMLSCILFIRKHFLTSNRVDHDELIETAAVLLEYIKKLCINNI